MVLLVATLCKSDKVERLYQAEGLPKNISIEELTFPSAVELNLLRRAKRQADYCDKHGVDYPTFDKWYRNTHKKVYPVTVKGIPSVEEAEIQTEAEKVSEEMEKDQLISMIHFLVKREDERAQENQELKDMVKELRDTHKQDVKTQTNLLKSIDNLTNQVADLTTQNKNLQQKVNDLLSQISVGNKV